MTGSIKIDKDIPLPQGNGGKSMFPWRTMEVGDSFFAPGKKQIDRRTADASYGIKTKTSRVVENGVEGVRVWRIA